MPSKTTLSYVASPTSAPPAPNLVIVGRLARLQAADVRAVVPVSDAAWDAMLDAAKPGDAGASSTSFTGNDSPSKLVACVLPEPCSRHNSPARPHAVSALSGPAVGGSGDATVLLALDDGTHALAAGLAVARPLHAYSRKAEGEDSSDRTVTVSFLADGVSDEDARRVSVHADSVRLAGELVDMPPSELTTDEFVRIAQAQGALVGASVEVIDSAELESRGYGGLWGVGKASTYGPALVVLTHEPSGEAESTLAWVGKGIVYDTGGLSIKGKDHMPGMKGDMGGAAAVLGAFVAAAKLGSKHRIHALLCLAENSVGPLSTRPDDILSMYSGKTVEVNNTDAEGRLVLADGVAHAGKHLAPDVIVDCATLTGAQLMATGKRHAGIVCNDEALEARAVVAGKLTGDLVHGLPYVPEFFRKEFRSEVADMKNSVKDRMNAQTSCAAQFVAEHLGDYEGPWLHVDLAGPSGLDNGRGTGYGVALLTHTFGI